MPNGGDSVSFEIRSGVRQGRALSPSLFNYVIDWILDQDLQGYPGFHGSTNACVSNLAYTRDKIP